MSIAPLLPGSSERVGRGVALALLAIPIVAVLCAAISPFLLIGPILAGAVPTVAASLYRRGSGGPLVEGRPQYTIVAVVGMLLSALAAAVSRTLVGFTAVNRGTELDALVDPSFWSTFVRQFTSTAGLETSLTVAVGIITGIFALVKVLRTPVLVDASASAHLSDEPVGAHEPVDASASGGSASGGNAVAGGSDGRPGGVASAVDGVPPATAPPAPTAPPSSQRGIILNGEPYEPKG